MKKLLQLLFIITSKLFLFSLFVLLAINKTAAQDSAYTAPDFPLGVWATGEEESDPLIYNSLDTAGFNHIVMNLENGSIQKERLSNYSLITQNGQLEVEKVYYYSNGMYTKWEAERDEFDFLHTGFKHPGTWSDNEYKYGQVENYLTYDCWATDASADHPIDSVLWGPHYRQDKNYRLEYLRNTPQKKIEYTVNYRMALENPPVDPNTEICSLYVYYRYAVYENGQFDRIDYMILADTIITAAQLSGGIFYEHKMVYDYPDQFNKEQPLFTPSDDGYNIDINTTYVDTDTLTGIEFRLYFFGKGKLYVDYVELYDNLIWSIWVNPLTRTVVISELENFLDDFTDWDNIKYWYGRDEPQSIDYYEPMRVVDSLIRTMPGGKPLITQFYPSWRVLVNGDYMLAMFNKIAKPEKLMIDYYQFTPSTETKWERLEAVRKRVTEAHSLQR